MFLFTEFSQYLLVFHVVGNSIQTPLKIVPAFEFGYSGGLINNRLFVLFPLYSLFIM